VLSYFIIFSQYKDIKWVVFSVLFSAIFSCIYCILRDDLLSEWGFRKTGGMGDPNEFSTTILFAIGLIWSYYIAFRKYTFFIVLLTFIFILGLLIAASKTALGVLFIYTIVIVYLIIIKYKGSQKFRRFLILAISFISALTLINYYFESLIELFLSRFESNNTADQRINNWKIGFDMLKSSWLVGVGPQNYANEIGLFDTSLEIHTRETHNMYLKVLFELGVFGFLSFMILIMKLLRYFVTNKYYSSLLISTSYLLMGFTLSLTYDKYVWLIIGLSVNPYFISFFKKKLIHSL
tara:strand:- start:509 stop:1387 length:879 start_codon:yes stop_codon:yes gene_type:complete